MYPLMQQIYIKHLLCARHDARLWRYYGEQDRDGLLPPRVEETQKLRRQLYKYIIATSQKCFLKEINKMKYK